MVSVDGDHLGSLRSYDEGLEEWKRRENMIGESKIFNL